jgi:tubby and related proteins
MEIIRDKGGFNFWPEFHLYFSEDSHYLMSAKKTSSRPTSTFIISRSRTNFEEEGPQYLGKMKSNVLGDVLNVFGPGLNPSNAKEKGVAPR